LVAHRPHIMPIKPKTTRAKNKKCEIIFMTEITRQQDARPTEGTVKQNK
jgi:hypothetical protein